MDSCRLIDLSEIRLYWLWLLYRITFAILIFGRGGKGNHHWWLKRREINPTVFIAGTWVHPVFIGLMFKENFGSIPMVAVCFLDHLNSVYLYASQTFAQETRKSQGHFEALLENLGCTLVMWMVLDPHPLYITAYIKIKPVSMYN